MSNSRLNELKEKYKDLIPYGIFGVLTTIVNIGGYWVFAHPLKLPVMVSTIVAWILAVLFAYVTNRKWVFHSEVDNAKDLLKEMISFFTARLATGVIDWVSMLSFVDMMHMNDMAVKSIANIVVIILNYTLSKYLIFRHSENK